MAERISPHELGEAVARELAAYSEEVSQGVKDEVKAAAKQTVSTLKRTSPRDTGEYARGWTSRVEFENAEDVRIRVYNRKKPQLTHLLEYGHAKVSGGRVEGHPHIRPAQQEAEEKLEGGVRAVVKG